MAKKQIIKTCPQCKANFPVASSASRMRQVFCSRRCAWDARIKHGDTLRHQKESPEFRTWLNMRIRCNNPKDIGYANYGGRGIKVCAKWDGPEGFSAFLKDMGRRPSVHHSIDRKNNDLGYSPENCRWATTKEQCVNTRSNRLITFNGTRQTLSEWARRTGIHRAVITHRLKSGWSIERALFTPTGRYQKSAT